MYRGNSARKVYSEKYTRNHIRSVLEGIGINVISETNSNFMAYCPFHGNRDTPSFTVRAGGNGPFLCFNPSCDETGNLVHLVKYMTKRNDFEAMRFIRNKAEQVQDTTQDDLLKAQSQFEWQPWNLELLAKMRAAFPDSPAQKYMVEERKFTLDTLDMFEVGYSEKQDMVAVPVHSPDGVPVGIVGRGVKVKAFKNSTGLPRNKTLFNLHRAKKHGDIAVVTESSFDTMRLHQAGFPNAVATLGGNISPENLANLDRYFSMIIIMTDDDGKIKREACRVCVGVCRGHNAGRELGLSIANTLRNKNILWGVTGYKEVYPGGVKDVGDMTDQQIAHCVNNAISHFEYISWGSDFH